MTPQIPQVTLNNGVQMPILGFGVDTAAAYVNEEAVG
jgi:diketogulonate reductase-like aldo/keto reductase